MGRQDEVVVHIQHHPDSNNSPCVDGKIRNAKTASRCVSKYAAQIEFVDPNCQKSGRFREEILEEIIFKRLFLN
jgi:hypothetical protein